MILLVIGRRSRMLVYLLLWDGVLRVIAFSLLLLFITSLTVDLLIQLIDVIAAAFQLVVLSDLFQPV
jgi:hypothetical protein